MNLFGFLLSWSKRQQAPLIGTTYSPGQFFLPATFGRALFAGQVFFSQLFAG
jgi:hypothetical protein